MRLIIIPDSDMMLPPAFWQGVEEFNQEQFYTCHDTLEALWLESSELEKRFYQGVLQVAVACYHLENQNWRGAAILLGEGMRRLKDYQPVYEQVDVAHLIEESQQLLDILQQNEPEQLIQWQQLGDRAMLPLPKIILNNQ